MTSSVRQYIAGYTVAIFYVIQSDVALQTQVHKNIFYVPLGCIFILELFILGNIKNKYS